MVLRLPSIDVSPNTRLLSLSPASTSWCCTAALLGACAIAPSLCLIPLRLISIIPRIVDFVSTVTISFWYVFDLYSLFLQSISMCASHVPNLSLIYAPISDLPSTSASCQLHLSLICIPCRWLTSQPWSSSCIFVTLLSPSIDLPLVYVICSPAALSHCPLLLPHDSALILHGNALIFDLTSNLAFFPRSRMAPRSSIVLMILYCYNLFLDFHTSVLHYLHELWSLLLCLDLLHPTYILSLVYFIVHSLIYISDMLTCSLATTFSAIRYYSLQTTLLQLCCFVS